MLGAVHGVTTGTAWCRLPDARVATSRETEADRFRLGSPDGGQRPHRREEMARVGPGHRIVLRGPTLVADHRATVVLEAHLPEARVAGEDRPRATGLDERVGTIAHRPRPVLVVSDAQHQAVTVEHLGVELEVRVDGVVEGDALHLRPPDKAPFPVVPAGRSAPQRVVEVGEIALELEVLLVRLVRKARHPAVVHHVVGRGRPAQVAPFQRTVERDLHGVAVQACSAPLVVGVVGVRAQHEDRRRRRRGRRRADDEERLGAPLLTGDAIGVQADLVVTGRPRRIDGDREGDRPAATGRVRVVANRMVVDADPVASPHLDPLETHPGDRDGDGRYPAAATHLDDVARPVALPIGIPLDRRPPREMPFHPILL